MPFTALNGRLPDSLLTHLPWAEAAGFRLRADAAASAGRLAAAFYARFGRALLLTDAYRTFASQVSLKTSKGVWAATPGTSNHGLGIAVDFASGINVDGSPQHLWMTANAGRFGWINPAWAINWNPADGQHEPWHWEYHPELDTVPAIPAPVTTPAATPVPPTAQEDDMIPYIQMLYRCYLGREPSPFDCLNWADRAAGAGWSAARLRAAFLGNHAEGGTVVAAYALFLGRKPSAKDITSWTDIETIQQVWDGVAGSPEAKARK